MGLLRKKYEIFNVVKSNQNHYKIFQNPRYRFSTLIYFMGLLRKKYEIFNVVKSDENHFKIFQNPIYRFFSAPRLAVPQSRSPAS